MLGQKLSKAVEVAADARVVRVLEVSGKIWIEGLVRSLALGMAH